MDNISISYPRPGVEKHILVKGNREIVRWRLTDEDLKRFFLLEQRRLQYREWLARTMK